MQFARAFREIAKENGNERLGKRLEREIYVASEASATPLLNYAPQSNFSASPCVSLSWTQGMQMLSSLGFLLPSSNPQGGPPGGRTASKHLISGGFPS
jgi:hypothetical protein